MSALPKPVKHTQPSPFPVWVLPWLRIMIDCVAFDCPLCSPCSWFDFTEWRHLYYLPSTEPRTLTEIGLFHGAECTWFICGMMSFWQILGNIQYIFKHGCSEVSHAQRSEGIHVNINRLEWSTSIQYISIDYTHQMQQLNLTSWTFTTVYHLYPYLLVRSTFDFNSITRSLAFMRDLGSYSINGFTMSWRAGCNLVRARGGFLV